MDSRFGQQNAASAQIKYDVIYDVFIYVFNIMDNCEIELF